MKTTLSQKIAVLFGVVFYVLTTSARADVELYVIAKGDSVASICQKFQISTETLLVENPDLNPTRLAVGQEIKIPAEPKAVIAVNELATLRQNANSPAFKSALNYGIAQTLYSTFDFNSWSSFCGPDMFQLTQNIHEKLGKSVRADIFWRKNDNDGSIRVSVFFPDFSIGNRKLVLSFLQDGTNYFFLEDHFNEEFGRYDFSETNVSCVLPLNCRSIIKTEFQLKGDEVARIHRWCREILESDHPEEASKTNHFFIAPYSERYDRGSVSLYWTEGEKVIRIERLLYPDGTGGFIPKVLSDFSEPIQNEKISDYAGACEWRNFVISRHVVDGYLLTVAPEKTPR